MVCVVVDGVSAGRVGSGTGVAVIGRVAVGVTVCDAVVVSATVDGGSVSLGGTIVGGSMGDTGFTIATDAVVGETGNVDSGSWVGVTVTITVDAEVDVTVDVDAVLAARDSTMSPVVVSISTVRTAVTLNRIAPRP